VASWRASKSVGYITAEDHEEDDADYEEDRFDETLVSPTDNSTLNDLVTSFQAFSAADSNQDDTMSLKDLEVSKLDSNNYGRWRIDKECRGVVHHRSG
jgi:hypothetical protein